MATIRVEKILTATESDVLKSTDLAQMPFLGALAIYMASDQRDGIVSIRIGGFSAVAGQNVPYNSGYVIDAQADVPMAAAAVASGVPIKVDYTEVTGANCRLLAIAESA